jgi:propanol-preferring alcohol dehydrogenase
MRAMVLTEQRRPLELRDLEVPEPRAGQLLLRVKACGICRTDLHVVDADLTKPKLPLVPGHQIVAVVEALGDGVTRFRKGETVGVPWLGRTCYSCDHCRGGTENLCDQAQFTGYDIDGGFAEYAVADEQFVFPIPASYPAVQAAPLLCAGLIGYRAYRMAGDAKRLGLYGFGAAAHILIQLARYQGREVYAFTRPGDDKGIAFAETLGAAWAGFSDRAPPRALDAAIIFAPVGELVPACLRAVAKGGQVVCAGIHMSDIPSFPYEILWGERAIRSVANLTRRDGEEFLALAPQVPIETTVHEYALEDANRALDDLRAGRFEGAAVLVID